MKSKLKSALSAGAAAMVVGGGFLAFAPLASAASSAPPFEPDANAAPPYGNIAFYDANGVQVTSGTGDLSAPFAWAVASSAADSKANGAIVNFYNPQHGVNPSSWTGTAETGTTDFSPASALPAGTPANLVADAPTYPVASMAGASITNWLGANVPDTTAGYANTIEVRLTDSGPRGAGNSAGTYWETDIGYNTGTSPIVVDGTTVPANGWAQLFPFVSVPTAPTLSITPSGNQPNGTALTLKATVPSSPSGYVVFEDNGTSIGDVPATAGAASLAYTPTNNSTNSFTASFVPTPVSLTGGNTTSATEVVSSTSAPTTVTESAPAVGTTTAVSASPSSISYGQSDTLTATVTSADSSAAGVAGSVQFEANGAPVGSPVATTVSGTTGTATLNTTALPQGTDNVTAVFTPSASGYSGSTSPATVVTVAAAAKCTNTGSSCTDTQNITVTVNPGTITVTTPYTATNPYVLPAMQLSGDGTYLYSCGTFPSSGTPTCKQNADGSLTAGGGSPTGTNSTSNLPEPITITSTLAPAQAWTLSVSASNLTSGANSIASTGLGLTNGALLNGGTATGDYSGTVTFTNIPALNPSVQDAAGTGPGLNPTTPQSFATSTAADGTAYMDGTLTLLAPTSTPPGTYNGTITFTVS